MDAFFASRHTFRMHKKVFFVGLILAASGIVSPPFALLGGLIYGLALSHPYHVESKQLSKFLLQASVVGLGFGMNLHQVVHAGRSGFLYTAVSITVVMLLGISLGYFIRVDKKASFLIAAGTAICGGSAIAAVGPIAEANEEEMAVSLGAVFILNSVALFLFPVIGLALHMTQSQFGLWSALAIHDTSSVVGATAKYGAVALAIGTTVKLARALWIVPLSVATAATLKSKARIQWPWFILFFCIAALLNTILPAFNPAFSTLSRLGKIGLTVTLFLIGTGLSKETLKKVGVRPLLQGLTLWIIVGTATLALILLNWIHI
ncbi:MAG TPA: putative sulfate exporter family transporter [Candidatus Acidoferrales bacterium]|nr:putative sulfate exporter family transporter [Candidatus Acidoferrales bacterium]